jgi:hypothetical protein
MTSLSEIALFTDDVEATSASLRPDSGDALGGAVEQRSLPA